jgi:hypothetical protein
MQPQGQQLAFRGELYPQQPQPHPHDVEAAQTPPKLRQRRSCCCSALVSLWWLLASLVTIGVVVQLAIVHAGVRTTSEVESRVSRDAGSKAQLAFGLWDSRKTATPLQLQVSVSIALGSRAFDEDVRVIAEDSNFFFVTVDHATIEESEFVNSQLFIDRVNEQLEQFGGLTVLSKGPRLVK